MMDGCIYFNSVYDMSTIYHRHMSPGTNQNLILKPLLVYNKHILGQYILLVMYCTNGIFPFELTIPLYLWSNYF